MAAHRWESTATTSPAESAAPPAPGRDARIRGRPAAAGPLRRLLAGGTSGNERLTAAVGVVLILLLAALGVTILRIRPLLGPHMFIGLLLIPPVLLKMASTGYRFARYYTHDAAYRRKGPPAANLRVIAPVVVTTTVVVFVSGVALMLAGPSSRASLLPIHKVSFFVWLAFMAIHVIGHLPDLPRALSARNEAGERLPGYSAGRGGRLLSLGGALVAGIVLGVIYIPQYAPWLNSQHFVGGH
jgi:hypothetical protein